MVSFSGSDASTREHKFAALDGIRGLLALCVVYMHFPGILYFPDAPKFNSGFCVDFFFLLSGFVIAHTTRHGLDTAPHVRRFMLRRVGRLWPLHATILGVLLLCKVESTLAIWLSHSTHAIPFKESAYLPYTILTNLLMLQGFDPNGGSWNFPSWSISVEFWVYALFAVLVWRTGKWAEGWGLCLVLAAISLQWALTGVGEVEFLGGALRCVAGFFTGFLVYRQFTGTPKPLKHIPTVMEVAAVAIVVGYMALVRSPTISAVVAVAFAVPLWVFAHQQGMVSRLLQSRACQTLGKWSFGIYMVHMPVTEICYHWLALAQKVAMKAYGSQCAVGYAYAKTASPEACGVADVAVLLVVMGLYLAIVLKCAQLSYRHIEAPARQWFNRRADVGNAAKRGLPYNAK